jgi:uncharacterized protein with HEPN domain
MLSVPSKSPAQRLRDILENIDAIREFVAGTDFVTFAADRRTTYAVIRALEIISEAVRRLPPELTDRLPQSTGRQSRQRATFTAMNMTR